MKKMPVTTLVFLLCAGVFLTFCKKPVKYPEVPEVRYLSLVVTDTVDTFGNKVKKAELSLYLIDGDGNIGFNVGDTNPPFDTASLYYHNLFVEMYWIDSGKVKPVQLAEPFYYRTPFLEPLGQNKTLKCTVKVDMDFLYSTQLPIQWDSVKFDFFMYDRAQNRSNTGTTDVVLLK